MPIDDFKTLPPEPLQTDGHSANSGPRATLVSTASAQAGATLVGARFAVPERIGKYRIKELIGAGGMGEVYEAFQEQPARTVALKVMRANIGSAEMLRRFEYESQLLANLRHPCIAQVYDAGTYLDPDSRAPRPYFVMEMIPGARPLTEYADESRLTLTQRLELFIRVCEAVGHAHQRGVIHRDLKPANILVDSSGAPKVIDFGIARSSDAHSTILEASAIEKNARRIVGTLEYMPPEQSSGAAADLDVRADVYSLGATLYELVCGRVPFDLAGRSIDEAVRVIQDVDPRPPSGVRSGISRDLDAIILKSLKKSRHERYDTALELAADVQRLLRFEPVLARRTGPAGKLLRWSKRNRALATALLAFAVVLSATTVTLAWKILRETQRANHNLRAAQDNLQTASENLALMRGLFSFMKPDVMTEGSVNVEHVLDSAVARLSEKPPTMPATEANFREFLGQGYRGVGAYTKAIEQQARVVEIREKLLPDPSDQLADSLHELGASLWWNGEYAAAQKAYERSLAMRLALHPGDHEELATSLTHLGATLLRQGRLAEAEKLYSDALAMRRRLFSAPHPAIAASLNNLAKCVQARGDLPHAESLLRQAYDMITSVRGRDHLETAAAAHNLALCLLDLHRDAEAIPLFEQAESIRTRRYGASHPQAAISRLNLARARFTSSPDRQTLQTATESMQTLEQRLPADHPEIADASTTVGLMHSRLGQFDVAERYFRTALSIKKDARRANAWEAAEARLNLGQCLANQNRNDDAERLLAEALTIATNKGAPLGLFADIRTALSKLYETMGRTDDAKRVRATEPAP
ncbi:MAG: tetratricopeptide repeat protein [Phycisphaerales bacterium]